MRKRNKREKQTQYTEDKERFGLTGPRWADVRKI